MSSLNDIDLIKKYDKFDMHHLIIHLPEQILSYFDDINDDFKNTPLPHFNQILIFGMGGSAISGDIAEALLGSQIPIKIVKDYRNSFICENTLCIFISYSGNTKETIDNLLNVITKTKHIVAITSGGKIKDIVSPEHHLLIIPSGLPARAAIGYLFFTLLKVLELYKIVPCHKEQIEVLIGNLMQKAAPLCFKTDTIKNLAKSSAESIYLKIPIIYASNHILSPVAYRWKCQINENAKLPAFNHNFPEMCHNEIEAYVSELFDGKFIPIILKSFSDDKMCSEKIKLFQSILDKRNIEYLEFYADGNTDLINIFTLIYLGDIISFYLAILNNVDPTEIKYINYIKNKLS